ncbi:MAG: VCBS repeat-containing protein [Myxococcota bacterium]
MIGTGSSAAPGTDGTEPTPPPDADGTAGASTDTTDDGADTSSGGPQVPDDGLGPWGFAFVDVPTVSGYWVEFGDFNGDGWLDLVAGGPDPIEVHTGSGTGSFAMVAQAGVTGTDYGRLGDFDGDGDLDVAAFDSSAGDGFDVLLNDGRGSMTASFAQASGFYGFPAAALHLDDDGAHDLFVPLGHSQGAFLTWSQGDGTFDQGPTVEGPACYFSGLGVGDFDGDGLDDVAGTGSCNSIPEFLPLAIYRHVDGVFEIAQGIGADLGPVIELGDVRVYDVDHDGDLDVLTPTHLGVYVIENLGDGVFADPPIVVPHTHDEYGRILVPIELGPDANPAFVIDQETFGDPLAALVVSEPGWGSSTTEIIDLYGRVAGTADIDGDGARDVAVWIGETDPTLGLWLSGG